MRKFTAFAAAILGSALLAASAQARPYTTSMTCHQVQDLIDRRGAVVMNTGRNTYDRFVANASYCAYGEVAVRAFVPTRDRRSCFIGYTCSSNRSLWWD